MHVVIARTMPEESLSMDVYADGLVSGLRMVRPEWKISETVPHPLSKGSSSWSTGLRKYYERFWHYPHTVAAQQTDVFHITDHSYGHLTYSLKKIGTPVVVTCHDLINFIYPKDISIQAQLPLVSMMAWRFSVQGLRQADHVITVSSYTAKEVVQKLNIEPKNITVVPDAIDSLFRPLPQEEVESFRQQHGASSETLCLLHVGSAQQRKNVFTILKVMATLKDKETPVHFWKIGADFTKEQKTFIQTSGLENFVSYLGKVDKHTLVQAYNSASIFLFPSLHEGFGMPVLEAMACGTPVITSDVSSLPEVAGDAAVLVEPTNVQAIVEAVLRLNRDSVYYKQLIDKGLTRVKSFTRDAVGEQVSLVYQQVLNQKTSKTCVS